VGLERGLLGLVSTTEELLTSLTSDGRSFCIVRSRTQATEFLFA
jgi:hypothetical protein